MSLSAEAIIALITLLVTGPPAILSLVHYIHVRRRYAIGVSLPGADINNNKNRESGGKFEDKIQLFDVKNAAFEGHSFHMKLDTACTDNLIRASVLSVLGVQHLLTPLRHASCYGIDEKPVEIMGQILLRWRFTHSAIIFESIFYVVDIDSPSWETILGQKDLDRYGIVRVMACTGRLYFTPQNEEEKKQQAAKSAQAKRMSAKNDAKVTEHKKQKKENEKRCQIKQGA